LIFSDEDTIRSNGTRSRPWFKSDWNPALMLSQNAVGRLGACSRDLVSRLGGFRAGYEGAEEYELILRSARATDPIRIRHIPRVLYHRSAGTRGLADTAKSRSEAERRAVGEHLAAQGISATVCPDRGVNRITFSAPHPAPRVTVVIATTARREIAESCFTSLAERTHYDDLEVLVLAHEADLERPERATFIKVFADKKPFRVIRHSVLPFNYSAVNNLGACAATGDVLCFPNDDTETVAGDWLQQLVARVALPGIGAAGPKLYYPDATIQHAGVILGLGGVAGHACCHQPRGSSGYFGRACLEQDVSCVTAACMTIRADVFRAVGGFDEKLPMAYNDVDLCLRVRALNWRIIWTPAVELLHHESASLGRHDSAQLAGQYAHDVALMRERWHAVLQSDPFYSPNLSLDHGHQLAFPPRLAAMDRPLS
jgi:GT2 family glycosyltransferase